MPLLLETRRSQCIIEPVVHPPDKLLRELIALPSVNPAFLPAGDQRGGEWRVADYLATLAAPAGLSLDLQEVFPRGPGARARCNLIVRLTPRKVAARLLLAPHLDTVGAAAMPAEHFQPRLIDSKIYGRGACDTKGSVAAMFTALLRVATQGQRPGQTEIIFVGLVDEENGQEGSRTLAHSRFRADLAIVGEPTRCRIVTAHKGDLWLRLFTRGKAAHGARPELGRNAVHAMARAIVLLETEYADLLRTRKHPLLGSPTINVGVVRGGTQPNIVPDACEISVDRRTIPGEKDRGIQREIVDFLQVNGVKIELANSKGKPCLPMETDPATNPLLRSFMSVCRQKQPLGVDFFCDASILSAGGIPSAVFGPGDIAQAHTQDEWIAESSLSRGTDLLERYLRSLP